MAQMNNRNRKTGTPMPSQQQTMQRLLPIMFAYFYLIIPAAVVLYMIISTLIRIITQDVMFRTGVSNPHTGTQRAIPAPEVTDEVPDQPKPSIVKPPVAKSNAKPPAPRPQPQSRSRAKRKRKAR
jgi:membrane protein insertase Oxa1/YidC/SpoIIIJ